MRFLILCIKYLKIPFTIDITNDVLRALLVLVYSVSLFPIHISLNSHHIIIIGTFTAFYEKIIKNVFIFKYMYVYYIGMPV